MTPLHFASALPFSVSPGLSLPTSQAELRVDTLLYKLALAVTARQATSESLRSLLERHRADFAGSLNGYFKLRQFRDNQMSARLNGALFTIVLPANLQEAVDGFLHYASNPPPTGARPAAKEKTSSMRARALNALGAPATSIKVPQLDPDAARARAAERRDADQRLHQLTEALFSAWRDSQRLKLPHEPCAPAEHVRLLKALSQRISALLESRRSDLDHHAPAFALAHALIRVVDGKRLQFESTLKPFLVAYTASPWARQRLGELLYGNPPDRGFMNAYISWSKSLGGATSFDAPALVRKSPPALPSLKQDSLAASRRATERSMAAVN
jgi:hypothetical protein